MKYTSTVLEPSIPFHTLVKLVDAEDIANDKIRTHDLALEVNIITNQLQTQILNSSQQEQLMFTEPRDPNNKKHLLKIFAPIVIEQITPSLLVSKNNEMTKTKAMHMLNQNLLKNNLFSTFVLPQTTEQNDMTHAIEVEVIHQNNYYNKNNNTQNKYRSTSTTSPPQKINHDMTIIKDIRDPVALLTDLVTDPLVDMTLVTNIDHARLQEITTISQDAHLLLDHLQDQKILDILDIVHIQIQGTNLIQYNHKPKMIFLTSKYTCIIHYSSRLEMSFLLENSASISVSNYLTYVTIAKLLIIKQSNTLNPSKILTVANQTEVPILHYVTVTSNTTIEDDSRQFTIPLAVADIKYNFLDTPFFEEYIQNINIQDFTLQFKYQSTVHANYTKVSSLLSKDYPDFSYLYGINSKTQLCLKPTSSKTAHFPIKNYYNLHFTTTPQNQFLPTIPHTYFSSKFCTTFNLIEVFTDGKPDTCATVIQNSTNYNATVPTGHIGHIEVPITNEKLKFY